MIRLAILSLLHFEKTCYQKLLLQIEKWIFFWMIRIENESTCKTFNTKWTKNSSSISLQREQYNNHLKTLQSALSMTTTTIIMSMWITMTMSMMFNMMPVSMLICMCVICSTNFTSIITYISRLDCWYITSLTTMTYMTCMACMTCITCFTNWSMMIRTKGAK